VASIWFFSRDKGEVVDTQVLTRDQFTALATEYFPNAADIAPLTVRDYSPPSCEIQQAVAQHVLAEAVSEDDQGITFTLFDAHDAATQFVGNMKECWRETGGVTIASVDYNTATGVDIYQLNVKLDDGKTDEIHVAVYRNVYAFTSIPANWEPWEPIATGTFRDAVDKALNG
jgi:hypothetical protein